MFSRILPVASWFVLLAVCAAVSPLRAQTQVSGTIPESRWTKAGSPYIISDVVYVDAALIIEPGVRVVFERQSGGPTPSLETNMNGFIRAIGTEDDSIVFTSANDDKWSRIGAVNGTMPSIFKYCVIEKALSGIQTRYFEEGGFDVITHCAFRNNNTGISSDSSSVYVAYSWFQNGLQAIMDHAAGRREVLILDHCVLEGMYTGVMALGAHDMTIKNCTFKNNKVGIEIWDHERGTVVFGGSAENGNSMYDNSICNMQYMGSSRPLNAKYNFWGTSVKSEVAATIKSGPGVPSVVHYEPFLDQNCEIDPHAAPTQTDVYGTIPSSVWTKAGSPYIIHGTVTVDSNLVIEPGVEVIFTYDNGLRSKLVSEHGFIHAVGTEQDSIRFTKDQYDQGTGWWIQFQHGDPLMDVANVFKYCVFENGTYGLYAAPSMEGRADTLVHCAIRNHDFGIYTSSDGARLFLSECVISNCERGISDANITNPTDLWIERSEIFDCQRGIAMEAPGVVRLRNNEIHDIDLEALITGSAGYQGYSDIRIGDEPEYCNRFYNCGVPSYYLNRTKRTAHARYNYWGSTEQAIVETRVWSSHVSYMEFLPFTDENCEAVPVGIEPRVAPLGFQLSAYPNPVPPGSALTLEYTMQEALHENRATLALTDILGREVQRAALDAAPGQHTARIPTAGLVPGMYFCTMRAGQQAQSLTVFVR